MFRKIQGRLLEYSTEIKSVGRKGGVILELENEYLLKMRYDNELLGEFPKKGSIVTVKIEDGRTPKLMEIAHSTGPLDEPRYTPVPEKKGDTRWPKMCFGCGTTEWRKLSAHQEIWQSDLIVQNIESWEPDYSDKKVVRFLLDAVEIPEPSLAVVSEELVEQITRRLMKLIKRGMMGFRYSLVVDYYTCTGCSTYSRKFHTYMQIAPKKLNEGFPDMEFTFANSGYTEVFNDHNPDSIRAKCRPLWIGDREGEKTIEVQFG